MHIPFDLETMSNEPPDFTGGWVDRVDLATGEHTVLYKRLRRVSGSAARTTSCSTTPAGSGSPTSARHARTTWTRARCTTPRPTASSIVEAAHGLYGPNGVGLSPDGDRVYVGRELHRAAHRVGPRRPGASRRSPMATVRRRDEGPLRLARRRGERCRRRRRDRRRALRRAARRLRARVRARCPTGSPRTCASPATTCATRSSRCRAAGASSPWIGHDPASRSRTDPWQRRLMANFADEIRARSANGERTAMRFEDDSWTWNDYVRGCRRARRVPPSDAPGRRTPALRRPARQRARVPLWLGAAALTGTVVVGINPTRRGAELARDITHTDCQLVVTEGRHRHLLDGLDLGAAAGNVLDVDSDAYSERARAVRRCRGSRRRDRRGRHLPAVVHVGHERRAEGVHPLAGPAASVRAAGSR